MSGDQVNAMKSQPQPRIMAPTRDDVLNNLQYFFGAPVSPEKLKDYQEHHAMCAARTHSPTGGHISPVDENPLALTWFSSNCTCAGPIISLTRIMVPIPPCARP